MKLGQNKAFALVGDLGATAAAAVTVASQWSQTLTPIVTLLVAIASLAWWVLRFIDRWQGRSAGE